MFNQFIRLNGLGPESTSFLFKVVHQLLPTQERVARTNPNVNGLCKAAGCNMAEREDVLHALVTCEGNGGVGKSVIDCVSNYGLEITYQSIIRLQFKSEESHEMPVVWVLAVAWASIWEARTKGKKPELYVIRAELEARINLLRDTRKFKKEAEIISNISTNLN